MEGQNIRGLIEAYSQVYETPEVLNEEVEQIDEMGQAGARPTGQNSTVFRGTPGAGSASGQGGRRGSGSSPGALKPSPTKPIFPQPPNQKPSPIFKFPQKPGTTPPTPAKPGSNTASPARPSATPTKPTNTQKPTVPAAPTKPAGSAMDQWAAANPKLAAAKAERDRTRGTSATTNPLMKDMKDRLPAPKEPAPSTAKTGFDLAKKGVNLAADVDIFDLVKGHLLDEGYAETEQNALVMMANMSEEWRDSIIMELTGGKGHPGYKAGSKDHGPMQDGHPADSMKRRAVGGTMSMRHGYHLDDMDDKDDDEDDYESILKQQARNDRERTRKPLRDKVKAARKKMTKEGIEIKDILALNKKMEAVYEAQRARENPEDHDKEEKRKYEPVRGERTPMPPRGDKRREDFEKWYAKHVR
jgi:hypothetical protein